TVRATEVRSIADDLDILVAFDQETIDVNYKECTEKSIILADSKFDPQNPEDSKAPLIVVPFTEIATELGTSLMKNMVAIGSTAALLNLQPDTFQNLVDEIFGRKGEEVVQKNMQAIQKGFEVVAELVGDRVGEW